MAWKCNNESCFYESPRYFGLCPKCKSGSGEESKDLNDQKEISQFQSLNFAYNGPPISNLIKEIDPNDEPDVSILKTKYDGFNAILSSAKGFIESQVCLLGSSPGTGKSTLCISIADENTLYISSEENFKQVNQRALRVNPSSKCCIMNSTSISAILEAIRCFNGNLVVIDSVNGIEFGVGYATVAKFVNEITKAIKETHKTAIIISQVGKTGEITGMNSIIHIVDTVLHLERSEISSNIIATSSKNRYGEIGAVAVFQHKADGFVEVDVDHMNPELEIGATYTETRFGHKLMTISIEALVAESGNAFGLRKSNGYNQNRLMQLIGIISYFGGIDLKSKDVYTAISNGLYTDDISIELAIANSILSSYFKVAKIKKAYGEIRLNGKISNGTLDGKEIKHINELIKIYKNK